MSSERVSIIIPVWNGRRYLSACLDALLAQEPPDFQVVVVDNASIDGSADFVAENYPRVQLIRSQDNMGFAGACNVGIKAARGEILVLLNQDTRVCPGWLCALVSPLQESRVGVAGCKTFYPDGKTIQHAGGWIEWPLGLAYHYGQREQDEGQWDVARPVEYVTGAAMAFRRDILHKVGLLDEAFWPGYYEDVDFCLRAREVGYEVWYIPDAVLIHEEGTSLTDTAIVSLAFHRGRLRLLLKHMAPPRFLEEFVPAERRHHLRTARGQTGHALRMAYLEAIPVAASLLPRRWQTDAGTIDVVLETLQQLYLFPTCDDESFDPCLRELNFQSSVPVVGPLIAGLRSLVYSVAARWAVRYLAGQQEAINRRLKGFSEQQAIANQLYVRSLVSLSREVAHAILQLESGTPDPRGFRNP